MAAGERESTARALVAKNKGILAADESFGTIEKRFKGIEIESTEENRRAYREMLFTTPGIGDSISGVILFDETIRQASADGTPFPRVLENEGVIPGIKVDKGAKALAGSADEKVTEGLDGLRERLNEYRGLGARFTKWRAVITIGEGIPTAYCIHVNAHALGRFAALSQEADLVPIVEPEVLMDGDHTIDRCYAATRATLETVFDELYRQGVVLEEMLLKPNMVLSGKNAPEQAGVQEVAEKTLRCLRESVPAAVPGIVSGLALAWGRALGEFGATLMFAGSFRGITQTVPLAIYERFSTDFTGALALSAVLVAVSAAVLLAVKLLSGPAWGGAAR